MANDWFRRKSWTELDSSEFFDRLKRSRGPANKAQYLRIQAVELLDVGTKEAALAAISLLRLLLQEYPVQGEIAPAYSCMGECQELLAQWDEAVSSYRKALHQQRVFPNLQTNAQLRFAQVVALQRRSADYGEALSYLEEWSCLSDFPVMVFMECSARAMIHHDRSEKEQACVWAHRALDAAERTHSGFRYHAKLGLAGEKGAERVAQMRAILDEDKP